MYEADASYIPSNVALARTDTDSSVSSMATAPNLPGPGRNVGLLFDFLGARVEKFMNARAERHGLGPRAVAEEISRLRRHSETTIIERHAGFVVQLTDKEERAFQKLCKKLLKYARFVCSHIGFGFFSLTYFRHRIRTNQFEALEEIINLAIEDPHARIVLAHHDIGHYLTPMFDEPDLVLSTSRALGSIENADIHSLWSGVLLGRLSKYSGRIPLNMISDSGFDTNALQKWTNLEGDKFSRYLRSLHKHGIYHYIRALKMSLR